MSPALKCEDPGSWTTIITPNNLKVCPDCSALIELDFINSHIQWHRGLNIWDQNYQDYRKDPHEEGGS